MDAKETINTEPILKEVRSLGVQFNLGPLIFETLKVKKHQAEIDEILARYERDGHVAAFYQKYGFLIKASSILELDLDEIGVFYSHYFSKDSVSKYISEFKKDIFAMMFTAVATDENIYVEADSIITMFRVLNKLLTFEKVKHPYK